MKSILLAISILMASVSVFGNSESSFGNDFGQYIVVSDHDDYQPEYRCVSNCQSRSSSGNCVTYAQDFCGYDAVCSPYCQSRSSSGNCVTYGSDQCSSY